MEITGHIEYRDAEFWQYHSTVYLSWWHHLSNRWSSVQWGTQINSYLPKDASIGLKIYYGTRVVEDIPSNDFEIKDYILRKDAEKIVSLGEGEWSPDKKFLHELPEIGWTDIQTIQKITDYLRDSGITTKQYDAVIASMDVLKNGNPMNVRFLYELSE
ncbi:MAG: hypothetical protein AAFV93_23660 [Chloroflexota bacterium]